MNSRHWLFLSVFCLEQEPLVSFRLRYSMHSFLTRFFSGRQLLFCLPVACAFWLTGVSEAVAQDQIIPVQPLPSSPLPSTVIPNSVPANGSVVLPANNAVQAVPAQDLSLIHI